MQKKQTDLISTILESYSSYLTSGRSNSETAWMIARDYMLLSQTNNQERQQQPQQQLQPAQQQQLQQVQQQHIQSGQQFLLQPNQQRQNQAPIQHQVQHLLHQPAQQANQHQLQHAPAGQVQQMQVHYQQNAPAAVQHQAGVSQHGQLLQPQHLLSHQHPGGILQQQHSIPKHNFGPAPAPPNGQMPVNGTSQHQNGMATVNRQQLAPSPGFSLQLSAFQPISQPHATAQQQSNNNVGL
jgi:hypothetical protein